MYPYYIELDLRTSKNTKVKLGVKVRSPPPTDLKISEKKKYQKSEHNRKT